MKPNAALLALLTSGCITPIDEATQPPADWPTLAIIEGLNCPDPAMVGCATVDFKAGTCTIAGRARKHEELHCRGYDHPGESTMRDAWQSHKRTMKQR